MRASSPACLRLSSARRSSVGAALIEGECTDADTSCWRHDDRGLGLVELECAMLSRWSTSSRHCFMAPQRGRGARRVVQQFSGRRQRPRRSPRLSGRLRRSVLSCRVHISGTWRWEVSSPWRGRSSFFLHQEVLWQGIMVLDDVDHGVEQENKQKPKAKPPTWRVKCRRGKSSAGWRNAPALNPKMRRGLKRFSCW
jgi:hypothetical protein